MKKIFVRKAPAQRKEKSLMKLSVVSAKTLRTLEFLPRLSSS